MNLSQLEYFVATTKNGSFSQAGKSLFVTPQAVSKAVGDLEKELGVKLLAKSGKSISPTSLGLQFSERAQETLNCVGDLQTFAQSHTKLQEMRGAITLCIATSLHRGIVIQESALEDLQQTYPRLSIKKLFNSSSSCLSAIENDIADAAIILGRVNNSRLECSKLGVLELFIALSADCPLSRKKSVSMSDLRGLPIATPLDFRWCYPVITRAIQRNGFEPNYVEVQPLQKDHQAFLTRDKGAMFVAGDQRLYHWYEGITIKSLPEDEKICIPVCFVNKKHKATPMVTGVRSYFMGSGRKAVPCL